MYNIFGTGGYTTTPGEAFGPGLNSYLRLAFGNIAIDQIPEAVERFTDGNF